MRNLTRKKIISPLSFTLPIYVKGGLCFMALLNRAVLLCLDALSTTTSYLRDHRWIQSSFQPTFLSSPDLDGGILDKDTKLRILEWMHL